jgi:hypothetical protein
MENFNADAYKPKEIADRIEQISVSKSVTDPLRVFALALLAGAFIAFAAAFFTMVTHGSNMSLGVTRLLGGLVFCYHNNRVDNAYPSMHTDKFFISGKARKIVYGLAH